MYNYLRKTLVVLLAVFLCFSQLNWNVFAEDTVNFHAYTNQSEVYVRANEETDLEVIVETDDIDLVSYKWYKLVGEEWTELENNTAQFHLSQYSSNLEKFKCTVSYSDITSTDIEFIVNVNNTLAVSDYQYDYYLNTGESVELHPVIDTFDNSGLVYQWQQSNIWTNYEYVDIDGANNLTYIADKTGNYLLNVYDQ